MSPEGEVRAELNEAIANSWKMVERIIELERQVEDLTREKSDLEKEVDWLRDRLSERPYS